MGVSSRVNPVAFLLAISTAACTWAQSRTHVYDSAFQIAAYELTHEQEAQFDANDGMQSSFWSAWTTTATGCLDEATIDAVHNYTSGDTANGPLDAALTIRFAYGDSGIYFLVVVQDDEWTDLGYCARWWCFAEDAFMLYGNKFSASQLYAKDTIRLPCMVSVLAPHQLNTTFFEVGLVAVGLLETMFYNYWNPAALSLDSFGCSLNNILYDRSVPFDEAAALGIAVDPCKSSAANVKVMEWRVGWGQWGGPNPPGMLRRRRGESVAVCFGYNDFDPSTSRQATRLFWRCCDPYSNTTNNIPQCFQDTLPTTPTSFDAWGDIVFDRLLDSAVAHAGVSQSWGQLMRTGSLGFGRYFTITGRCLGSSVVPRNQQTGILLQQLSSRSYCRRVQPVR